MISRAYSNDSLSEQYEDNYENEEDDLFIDSDGNVTHFETYDSGITDNVEPTIDQLDSDSSDNSVTFDVDEPSNDDDAPMSEDETSQEDTTSSVSILSEQNETFSNNTSYDDSQSEDEFELTEDEGSPLSSSDSSEIFNSSDFNDHISNSPIPSNKVLNAYNNDNPKSVTNKPIICGVCLEEHTLILSDDDNQVMATVCGHIFCKKCIRICFKNSQTCPICRKSLHRNQIYHLHL